MKVFVTGGSGWVGRHTVAELIAHGHQVFAIARSDKSIKTLEDLGASVIKAGLEDTDVLAQQAASTDATIHLAYVHDFSDYGADGRPAQVDRAAIQAMAGALVGSNKPLITTTGTIGLPPNALETDKALYGPRADAENLSFSYADKGVRPISIRLAPSVHGQGDWGFVPMLIGMAKKNGYVAYPDDGASRWPGVHVKDAARLYRLAVEKDIPGATALHGVDLPSVSQKEMATIFGQKLGLEVKSIKGDDIQSYFTWLALFVANDSNVSNTKTKELTGWEPKEIGLKEDIAQDHYYQ
ncbi:hypothetical protein IAU60_006448 [Kwoniella sp. DSM 27419]